MFFVSTRHAEYQVPGTCDLPGKRGNTTDRHHHRSGRKAEIDRGSGHREKAVHGNARACGKRAMATRSVKFELKPADHLRNNLEYPLRVDLLPVLNTVLSYDKPAGFGVPNVPGDRYRFTDDRALREGEDMDHRGNN